MAGRIPRGYVFLVAAAVLLGGCGTNGAQRTAPAVKAAASTPGPAAPSALTIGAVSPGADAFMFPYYTVLTDASTFWKQAGLRVSTEYVAMGQAPDLLQTGRLPVVVGIGVLPLALGRSKGITGVKEFLGQLQKPPLFFIVRKGISSFNQVKTVGVPAIQSNVSQCASDILAAHHVSKSAYTLVLTGTGAEAVTALAAGKVDATCAQIPFAQEYSVRHHLKILANYATYRTAYAAAGWAYSMAWAKSASRRDTLVRIAKAYLLALQWTFAPAHRHAVIGLIARTFHLSSVYAGDVYNDEVLGKVLTPDGYVTRAAVEAVIPSSVPQANRNPALYYNWSFLTTAAQQLHIAIRKPTY